MAERNRHPSRRPQEKVERRGSENDKEKLEARKWITALQRDIHIATVCVNNAVPTSCMCCGAVMLKDEWFVFN
jgi:hypothetical protein